MEPWILTYTGRKFWPLEPKAEDVCIEDIAHALSNICRYGGHSKHFYSVAQHSWLVSYLVHEDNALWGLMHDAAEAYIGDMVSPLKGATRFVFDTSEGADYQTAEIIEERVQKVIAEALDLPWPPPNYKAADHVALMIERNCLMPDHPDWPKDLSYSVEMIPARIRPLALGWHEGSKDKLQVWDSRTAKMRFIQRYRELTE